MRKRIATAVAISAIVTMLSGGGTASASPQTEAQALAQAIASMSPEYLYALADQPGSTTAVDSSAIRRRPLTVVDANATGRTGDGVTFDGTAATLGGAQYLDGGPRLRMHKPRTFSLELTFQAPADYPGGVRYLAVAQGWRIFLANSSIGPDSPVYVGWEDRAPQPDGHLGQSVRGVDVSTGVHQVVAIGQRHTMTFYLDGQAAFTAPTVGLRRGVLSVGGLSGLAGYNTGVGVVRDVAAWKRPLTPTEVSTLWSVASS